ncbi:Hypothetical protein NTJ_06361 [Nesidiocoris tenuis]|uniref:Uncharacterized protein n=1 Tax=Nesidiocoris tenuis TaxID=355587 RepID=A0ABN7AMT8_9HEMI|nr:Hypothetical protein NTJ_06361 [Nesidiocoris tenuis]
MDHLVERHRQRAAHNVQPHFGAFHPLAAFRHQRSAHFPSDRSHLLIADIRRIALIRISEAASHYPYCTIVLRFTGSAGGAPVSLTISGYASSGCHCRT